MSVKRNPSVSRTPNGDKPAPPGEVTLAEATLATISAFDRV